MRPTKPPSLTPTSVPSPDVRYWEDTVVIATYPYAAFLKEAYDEALGQFPYKAFDRDAYLSSHPRPRPQTYKRLNLENRYVHVSFLPELGGRLYQLIFRPTGSNELYQNPVVKPTDWGPTSPPRANWWLAVGGIEWGFPVDEHGYEFGVPWKYHWIQADDGYGVKLWDGGEGRPNVRVQAVLRENTAAVELTFQITNPTAREMPLKFWSNAMVAPGPANTLGSSFQFIYPIKQAVVHSTSDPDLPAPYKVFSWPLYKGRDFSYPTNWRGWVGFFAYPRAKQSWAAVYDHNVNEGLVRLFPPTIVPGLKGFGFGNAISPSEWTDDGSTYAEVHGGIAPTFRDWKPLSPHSVLEWTETWYPIWQLGSITSADERGAWSLSIEGNALDVAFFPTRPYQGTLALLLEDKVVWRRPVVIAPDTPWQQTIRLDTKQPLPERVRITLTEGSRVLLEHEEDVRAQ